VSDPATALPMDPALRELGKVLHERYTLAARIARATWPAEETSPEAMVAATATVFIAMNQMMNGGGAHGGQAAVAPVESLGTTFPTCPKCHGPTVAASRKTPRSPHYRCADRSCDTPIWTDHKKNGTHL
jgi:hypothetical protein